MRDILKNLGKMLAISACALLLAINFEPEVRAVRGLPNNVYIDANKGWEQLMEIKSPFIVEDTGGVPVGNDLSERFNESMMPAEGGEYKVRLFGIPIKKVNVHVRQEVYVMPGGQSIGISMHTKGVLVVGLGAVTTALGTVAPAADAGIRPGDLIVSINNIDIKDAAHFSEICMDANGEIAITLVRNGRRQTVAAKPALDVTDGIERLGMWVRESTAGIGTMSFYVMSTLKYGALGHGVTDADTGEMLSVRSGEILRSTIMGVVAGTQGAPGEIKGTFNSMSKKMGSIEQNTNLGIFGKLYAPQVNPLYPQGVKLAYPDEVQQGAATLLTSVDSDGVKAYSCEIVKLYSQNIADTKGMVIRITDEQLLKKTGGIVQGMSGSPVLQNGKLVGAITHVFINDPTKGYCVYAMWMNDNCESQTNVDKAS